MSVFEFAQMCLSDAPMYVECYTKHTGQFWDEYLWDTKRGQSLVKSVPRSALRLRIKVLDCSTEDFLAFGCSQAETYIWKDPDGHRRAFGWLQKCGCLPVMPYNGLGIPSPCAQAIRLLSFHSLPWLSMGQPRLRGCRGHNSVPHQCPELEREV